MWEQCQLSGELTATSLRSNCVSLVKMDGGTRKEDDASSQLHEAKFCMR